MTQERSRRRSDVRVPVQPSATRSPVLFVDDEPTVCRAFERLFRGTNASVTTAESPAQALDLARARQFKVVVTDLRMPGMDGLTLIERLRGIQPQLVFIIVTGMPDLDLRRSASTDASILSTVAKPWDADDLREMVERAVELYDRRLHPVSSMPPGRFSVLVVEDDPDDAAHVKRLLERRCDAMVEVAGRVGEAEVLLTTRQPDVIISDLSLPDARGVDAVRRIRRAASESAVIVMSGIDDEALARQSLRLGAQDFLLKGSLDGAQLERALVRAREREAYVNRLVSLAHFDPLTGLANRRTLQDRYNVARVLARQQGTQLGFLSVDLDRFKTINDTLGHEAGDKLLQEVARRLRACVREHDTVARLGGDEFAVLLTELDEAESATVVAQRLVDSMRSPVELDGASVLVTMSVGSIVPELDATLDDVLRTADKTMYQAKRSGRNQVVHAGGARSRESTDRLSLESEISEAVRERRFTLAYQPQYAIADHTLVGFEALMRWTRQDGTPVSPGVFIPLLEELRLISDLGPWLLEEACAELVRFRGLTGRSDVRMAVNLSGQQFERPGLVEAVGEALDFAGLEPAALELEITENLLMRDTNRTRGMLDGLADLGVRVAIDDFGTGYSSLAYLQRFRVSTLKIDRCFIQRLNEDKGSCIAEAIIGLGQRLGMEIVAEGVETCEQLERLARERCDIAQGFLFSRPLPSTEPFHQVASLAVG